MKPAQPDFSFAAVAFNLYSDSGVDGDTIARAITEAEEAKRAREDFEARAQVQMFAPVPER